MCTLRAFVRPKTAAGSLIATLLLWNPVLALAFAFVLSGTAELARSALAVLVVADVVVLECFAGMCAVRVLGQAALDRSGARESSVALQFLSAAVWIPVALPLAFAAGGFVARGLGLDWGALDATSYRAGIGIGLVLTTVFFFRKTGADAEDSARAAEGRANELENLRLRAELAALTAEMNPHLLFNALNTVAALIHRDPDRAEEVVLELSELYRGVLRSASATTHPLADELRLCNAYLRIVHARFGQRLVGEIVVDRAIDTEAVRVPVLLLQPFVENAVEHGLSERARGGKVRVDLRRNGSRLDIVIEDDGVGFGKSSRVGAGKAITNCKERLALAYGDRACLEIGASSEGGARVVMSLPVGAEG
jgi:two-component sensor histidine kinase